MRTRRARMQLLETQRANPGRHSEIRWCSKMHGVPQDREAEASLMLGTAGTVQMIRDWVESSLDPKNALKFPPPGPWAARFNVHLSLDMWVELQDFVKASSSMSGLQLKCVASDSRGLCVEALQVLMTQHARAQYQYTLRALELLQMPSPDRSWAQDGIRTPEPRGTHEAPSTPIKELELTRRGKRCRHTTEDSIPDSKRSKDNDSRSIKPLTRVRGQEVPADLQGIFVAKEGLNNALATGNLKETVSWLKGLGKRKVAAHELEKTRIGLTVSLCRKQADPYVTKLADLLLQRRRQSSMHCVENMFV